MCDQWPKVEWAAQWKTVSLGLCIHVALTRLFLSVIEIMGVVGQTKYGKVLYRTIYFRWLVRIFTVYIYSEDTFFSCRGSNIMPLAMRITCLDKHRLSMEFTKKQFGELNVKWIVNLMLSKFTFYGVLLLLALHIIKSFLSGVSVGTWRYIDVNVRLCNDHMPAWLGRLAFPQQLHITLNCLCNMYSCSSIIGVNSYTGVLFYFCPNCRILILFNTI